MKHKKLLLSTVSIAVGAFCLGSVAHATNIKQMTQKFVPMGITGEHAEAIMYNNGRLAVSFEGKLRVAFEHNPNNTFHLYGDGTEFYTGAAYLLSPKYNIQAIFNYGLDVADAGTYQDQGVETDKLYGGFASPTLGQLTYGWQDTAGDYASLIADPSPDLGEINLNNAYSKTALVYQSPTLYGLQIIANYNTGRKSVLTATGDTVAIKNKDKGFGVYLQDTVKLSKRMSLINQFAYNKDYHVSKPWQSKSDYYSNAGSQQAFTFGTNLSYNNFMFGINYSRAIAASGTGVNFTYTNNGGLNWLWNNLNANGGQRSVSAWQIATSYQYTNIGSDVYIAYEHIKGRAVAGDPSGNGNETSQGVVIGTQYFFNPNFKTFVETGFFHGNKKTGSSNDHAIYWGFRYYF